MSIIKQKINDATYLYEVKYISFENGRRKYKKTCLGRLKLDENGNEILIPSKKNRRKAMKDTPAELVIQTITTKYILREKN